MNKWVLQPLNIMVVTMIPFVSACQILHTIFAQQKKSGPIFPPSLYGLNLCDVVALQYIH